ncbi:glycine betaine ABC transporter substrate-binding protein [Streptomyces sp. NPDC001922]|uniref:glycine betaine ABC transporter substrate-binding protein n=1 Tax=Streptomyces sp. NPDC001922 TaxID=3364624 RepID=UPI00368868E3
MRRTRTTRRVRTRLATTAVAGGCALLLAAATLSGCGLTSGSPLVDDVRPGSVGQGRPLEGARLTVTSKQFTEQIILGQMMGLAFKAAGAEVLDRTNIQGSIGAREAVKSGAADGMYEYTGTAWITYLGHTAPIVDPYRQWVTVRDEDRKNGITWLPPAPLDNTYALAANPANAKKYRLRTLSDVARLTKTDPGAATLCVESEFAVRDDGLPGLQKKYGFTIPPGNIKKMDSGIVYTQVSKGAACTLGEVFTTDGRIPELDLTVLEDNKHFFPNYNAAPEINTDAFRKHPEIADVLDPISKRLTTRVAQQLNAKVDVGGEDPHDVALDWLVQEGFIKEG